MGDKGSIPHLALKDSNVSSAWSLRRGMEVLKAWTIRGRMAGRAAARNTEPRAAARSKEADCIFGGGAREVRRGGLAGRMSCRTGW